MSFNIRDAYATVWQTKVYDNFVGANLTSSRKDKRDDKYINSSWRAVFVGAAKDKAAHLQDKDFIVITSGQVEMSPRIKENNHVVDENNYKVYDGRVTVFDFEMYENYNKNEDRPNTVRPQSESAIVDSDLPF